MDKVLPKPPHTGVDHMDPGDLTSLLAQVSWKRRIPRPDGSGFDFPWEGIAGTPRATGAFTPVGAKQAGHAVYRALVEGQSSDDGKQIRP
jgi:hypothetical protein